MIRKSGHRFFEKIMLKQKPEHDPEKWTPVFRKIMHKQKAGADVDRTTIHPAPAMTCRNQA
jgi:hypothetical protein